MTSTFRLKVYLLYGCVAAIGCIIALFMLDFHEMCGKEHLEELCNHYKQNRIAGPLCHDLCEARTLTFGTCLSTQPDKSIYKGTWKNKEVILKIQNQMARESYIDSYSHLQTNEDCKNEIGATVKMLFGECENCSDLVDKLAKTADVDNDGQLSVPETMTMVTLLESPEPSMLLVLNDSKHLLEMYGYCGRLYAVEKLPVIADQVFGCEWKLSDVALFPSALEPFENFLKRMADIFHDSLVTFKMFDEWVVPFIDEFKDWVYQIFFRIRIPSLEERFQFSFSLLDSLLALSSTPYGMFQNCDSHLGNFGLSKSSEVKITDGDEVFPIHHIQNILSSKKCKTNRDCIIRDECMSKCNKSTGFCTAELQKLNLQNVCPDAIAALVFRNIHKDLKNRKLICLEKAIYKLGLFCLNLSSEILVSKYKQDIQIVKEKLLNISREEFKDC